MTNDTFYDHFSCAKVRHDPEYKLRTCQQTIKNYCSTVSYKLQNVTSSQFY